MEKGDNWHYGENLYNYKNKVDKLDSIFGTELIGSCAH